MGWHKRKEDQLHLSMHSIKCNVTYMSSPHGEYRNVIYVFNNMTLYCIRYNELKFGLFSFSGVAKGGRCQSPQSLVVETRGVVSCQFTDGFTSIHWYNSSDYISDLPVVSYENTKKSGEGFETREFDIQEDGSLVINRVAIKHETTFSVLQFKAGEQVPNIYQINIHTKSKSMSVFPHQSFNVDM